MLLDKPVRCVLYHYMAWQPAFDDLAANGQVQMFVEGPPTMDSVKSVASKYTDSQGYSGVLVIMDDFGTNITPGMRELAAVGAHHLGIAGICFLQQNLFSRAPFNRDLSLNSQILVLFNSPRDRSMISNFARQFCPGKGRYLMDAYNKIMEKPYSYMIIDLHQSCPDKLRVRSDIFPHEAPMKVWLPKSTI